MTIILALELPYEIVNGERGKYFVFLLSNFSYTLQTIYYWITFVSPAHTPWFLLGLIIFGCRFGQCSTT